MDDVSARLLEVKNLHSRKINDIDIVSSSTGVRVVTASSDGTVKLLKATSERSKPREREEHAEPLTKHAASVHCARFVPATEQFASLVLSGGDDACIKALDARDSTGQLQSNERALLACSAGPRSLSVSFDGSMVALSTRDDVLEVHDLNAALYGAVHEASTATSQQQPATATRVGWCKLATMELHEVSFAPDSYTVWCTTGGGTCEAFAPTAEQEYMGSRSSGSLENRNADGGDGLIHLGRVYSHSTSATCIACAYYMSGNKKICATGSMDMVINVMDLDSCMPLFSVTRHEQPVTRLCLSDDGMTMVSSSSSSHHADRASVLDVYDLAHKKGLISTKRNNADVESLAISPSARSVLFGVSDSDAGSLFILPLPAVSTH